MLEGIMMKNKSQYSVAVRRPDGEIEVKTDEYVGIAGDKAWAKLPLIRGMVNFIDSMILGMKTLSWSASFYEDEEEEAKPGKFEKFLLKLFGGLSCSRPMRASMRPSSRESARPRTAAPLVSDIFITCLFVFWHGLLCPARALHIPG